MVRLKFLLFALLVLALWLGHLLLVSPSWTARAVEQAGAHARAAAQTVRATVAERRAELAMMALQLAPTPALSKIARAPVAERAALLGTLAREQAPEGLRASLIVGAGNAEGGTFLRPDGAKAEGDPSMLAAAGRAELVDVDGVPHAFVTFPLAVGSNGTATWVGALGLPLSASQEAFDQAVAGSGLVSVALLHGTRVVAMAGEQREVAAKAAPTLAAGEAKVVERAGATRWVGLSLPLFSEGSLADAPSLVGSRDAVEGSPYEVVAVASTRGFSSALASYQQVALPAAGLLLLLSLIWLVWIGRGPRAVTAEETEAPSPPQAAPVAAEAAPEAGGATGLEHAGYATGNFPGGAEATGQLQAPQYAPDTDAPFADSRDVQQHTGEPPLADIAFQFNSPPAEPPPGSQDPAYLFGEAPQTVPDTAGPQQDQTRAYPAGYSVPAPAVDPYAGASYDDNPDATRVAAIPQELLAASARSGGELRPEPPTRPVSTIPPSVATAMGTGTAEDPHFQDVFREFVSTREKCGEASDGLTYDKFVQKLRKNREQLVQKYNCRTVRFQVYVKDGKAALKATPVRD
ncbi:MAG: hypothetical protein M3Y59_03255 [Myxococcota bacterium]|nr:hypothetical protein [Myxococcota bacterium]